MKERPRRSEGMQDPRLEVGKPWHEKVTPTTGKDIGVRAQVYVRLIETAVTHSLIVEGANRASTQGFKEQSEEALATVRDEVRAFGFMPELFDEVVKDKIAMLKKKEKEQEEDAELQARLGDVPPVVDIVNFGNHAFKKADAGGFESPSRRGW